MCIVRARARPTVGSVPVSSLIFVVIVAIWAAYLVQHWLRRREDAAAGRSVEGFSEAMRVLEKRPVVPPTDLRTPRPRSYSVVPARLARPTVDVKRAAPAGPRRSPLVARRSEEAAFEASLASQHAEAVSPEPREEQPERRVSMTQRRLRALVLLSAIAWLPVSVTLTIRGVLLWVSVPFAALTVVAVLFWLRTEAQADRFRAAATRGVRRVRRAGRSAVVEPTLSADDTQIIQGLVSEVRAASAGIGVARVEPAAARAAEHAVEPAVSLDAVVEHVAHEVVAHEVVTRDVVFDVQAVDTGAVPTAAAQPEELPEGSWSPVPVPKPTYTLKSKAETRYTEGGIPADVFDTPEFADEADELDDRAMFARRAASQ
jgi:uncharacterized membrane protein